MKLDKIKQILEKHGAVNIEGYSLISNYGYTFTLNNKSCDARFWVNCYGASPMAWTVSGEIDAEAKSNIVRELNEIGG